MRTPLFERHAVVDVDSHLTEPPDTWTSRVSSRWGDLVPHIERIDGRDRWVAGGLRLAIAGQSAMAGFDGLLPDAPATYDDMHPAAWNARARLDLLDELGIHAQVLYPNIGGFGASYWLNLEPRELAVECVRAYNDFLTEFCSVDSDRLIAVTSIPFWDLDASVAEITRCLEAGHRGINMCSQPDAHGQPPLFAEHWDPVWALAREAGVPVNFHVGGGDVGGIKNRRGLDFTANFARISSLLMMDNMKCVADLIFGGVCHRYPEVNFVSVESGIGFLPALLETFDWQWRNGSMPVVHAEYDLLPSEYFRRQIYGCFWFERASARFAIEQYPDNVLFETDFPHPTCQYPGPRTPAVWPGTFADDLLADLDPDVVSRVLGGTAAKLYRIPSA